MSPALSGMTHLSASRTQLAMHQLIIPRQRLPQHRRSSKSLPSTLPSLIILISISTPPVALLTVARHPPAAQPSHLVTVTTAARTVCPSALPFRSNVPRATQFNDPFVSLHVERAMGSTAVRERTLSVMLISK